jgi:hypothetical protein
MRVGEARVYASVRHGRACPAWGSARRALPSEKEALGVGPTRRVSGTLSRRRAHNSRLVGVVVGDDGAREALHQLRRVLEVRREDLCVAAQVVVERVARPPAERLHGLE